MKHKAWFRLVMKTCGLLMMIIGVTMAGCAVVEFTWRVLHASDYSSYGRDYFVDRDWFYAIPFLVIGTYLCFRGEKIVAIAFPSGPKCCPSCGYQVQGNVSGICSECGAVLPPEFRVTNHE